MLQIALVADEHDDDVRIGVVTELLQPSCDVHVRCVLGDVVDKERADRTTVVSRCERQLDGRRRSNTAKRWEIRLTRR